MILPSQALHQHRQHCLSAVSHDFALLGANFARIGTDFAHAYPRPLYSRVGGVGFFSCSRVAAPLRRVQAYRESKNSFKYRSALYLALMRLLSKLWFIWAARSNQEEALASKR